MTAGSGHLDPRPGSWRARRDSHRAEGRPSAKFASVESLNWGCCMKWYWIVAVAAAASFVAGSITLSGSRWLYFRRRARIEFGLDPRIRSDPGALYWEGGSGPRGQDRSHFLDEVVAAARRDRANSKKSLTLKRTIPRFLYLDQDQLDELYSYVEIQVNPLELVKLVLGADASLEARAGLDLPALGGHLKGATTATKGATYAPKPVPLAQKLTIVLNYLIQHDGVTFGLEDFPADAAVDYLSHASRAARDELRAVGLEIPSGAIKIIEEHNVDRVSRRMLAEFASVEGYAVLNTKWAVSGASEGVTALEKTLDVGKAKPRLAIPLDPQRLTDAGAMAIKPGKSVAATVLGSIVRWDDDDRVLNVRPIAIY